MIWQVPCLLVAVSVASSLELRINSDASGASSGFYNVYVNDALWLESGQLMGYMNHRWYSSNVSESVATKKVNQNEFVPFWPLKLLSINNYSNLNDDFNGMYDSIDYKWVTNDNYSTIFHTIFKIYHDKTAISFLQYFPNGANGTNWVNSTTVPKGFYGDSTPNSIISFPCFNSIDNKTEYSKNNLAYLAWADTDAMSQYGKGMASKHLNGVLGGPLVLYDSVKFENILARD